MAALLPGSVAWHVTGRFYVAEQTNEIQDLGYFILLPGIQASLFDGSPSEATAWFTFSSDPFTSQGFSNADLSLGLDSVGGFTVYQKYAPGSSFDEPTSFSDGNPIAYFERVGLVLGTTVGLNSPVSQAAVSVNVFTASLKWSKPFSFGGLQYDLGQLIPNGVTQWGTASTQSVAPIQGYTSIVPFVGSSIAI